MLILADGCARISRATPLWLSRSCISVLFGISTCEQLETVVSRQTAEYIERPACQLRGARLHLSCFINSGCCPAKVRRCWSDEIRSSPWVLLHSNRPVGIPVTSKNKPREADAPGGWNLSRGTSHCPAGQPSKDQHSLLRELSRSLYLIDCTLQTFVTLWS